MIVTVNGHDLELKLADNPSAHALTDLAGDDGLQLTMQDYGGFEKVGTLPSACPPTMSRSPRDRATSSSIRATSSPSTTAPIPGASPGLD